MRTYFVYILANRSRGLYLGVTNDLARRLAEHRSATASFSARYRCNRLVFVETTPDVTAAIAREKQLKRWRREKKVALIEALNPGWDDLSPEMTQSLPTARLPERSEGLNCETASADPSTRFARSG